ncbi:MAG: hypothetical protein ABW199_09800, partial [Caulobacterales bacterium]
MTRIALLLMSAASLAACATTNGSTSGNSRAYADYLIGRVANLTEDHRVASDRYYTALSRDPNDRYLIEGGVRASLATGDHARAREIARHDASGDDGVAAAFLVRSADALIAGRWSSARALADHVNGDLGEEFGARILQVWAKA